MTRRNEHQFNTMFTRDKGYDQPCSVTYNGYPGCPAVMYLPNGDPGYPAEPREVEILEVRLLIKNLAGTRFFSEDILGELSEKELDQLQEKAEEDFDEEEDWEQ